jgi:hypothetical protein
LLALNRELYDAPHGLDLYCFAHSTSTTLVSQTDAADVHPLTVAMDAEIVADRLLLRTTYSVSPASGLEDATLRFASLSALDLRICRHSSTTERSSPWYDNSLVQSLGARKWIDEEGDEDMNELFGIEDARTVYTGTCSFCMMDWRVEKEGKGIVITTWMHLGGREERTVVWSAWRAAVGKRGERDHECRILRYNMGVVRDAFECGEAEVEALLDASERRP